MSKRPGALDKIYSAFLDIDQFGTEFKFKMPDGRTKKRTLIGVCMTLTLIAVLLAFVIYRLIDISQGPIVIDAIQQDYFDIDTVFSSSEENFSFAFGITDFDGGIPLEED